MAHRPLHRPAIIILPMIFGLSVWYRFLTLVLGILGYRTVLINPYVGQIFRQPFFISLITGNEKEKLDDLAAQFDHAIVQAQLGKVISQLKGAGYDRIVLFGSSLGAVFSFEYALAHPNDINEVIAWYPNLIFPKNFVGPNGQIKQPPDLSQLKTKTHIFIGERDSKLDPKTLEHVRLLAKDNSAITFDAYPQTDHAFFEATIQYFFPNPYFKPRISLRSFQKALGELKKL